ncbi:MAG: rRNA maturation RNase YbeY [Dissulfurispiraceae bacterium]|jgi:rRNA maturation RNase YbeY|nr:rRNA maturation RNase YbeY [Dissulfurispiraceae bacterium]
MLVEIGSTLDPSVFNASQIKKTAEKLYQALYTKKRLDSCYPEPVDAELSIFIIGDKKMRSLNLEYRKKDKTTDILSFPLIERTSRTVCSVQSSHLGDIVINIRQAQRQAKMRGAALKSELQWLIAHGILHLVGYDHEKSSSDEAEMRLLEQELLSGL